MGGGRGDGVEGEVGTRESEYFFFTWNPNLNKKKNFFFFRFGNFSGGGGGGPEVTEFLEL